MDMTYKKIIFAALIFGVALNAGDDILYQYKVLGNSPEQFNEHIWSGEWSLVRVERMQFVNEFAPPVAYMPVVKRLRTYQIHEMVSKIFDRE